MNQSRASGQRSTCWVKLDIALPPLRHRPGPPVEFRLEPQFFRLPQGFDCLATVTMRTSTGMAGMAGG